MPNVLLKNFVPQKELLNDDRVKAFVSHGGGNSIIESLYFGKVLIGAPISADQAGTCYRTERMGIGKSLQSATDAKTIISTIQEVVNDPSYSSNIKRVQKMIEFKELRSGKDLAYFMRRAVKFHEWSGGHSAQHLINTEVRDRSFFTVYDYDIKLEFVMLITCIIFFIYRLIKR